MALSKKGAGHRTVQTSVSIPNKCTGRVNGANWTKAQLQIFLKSRKAKYERMSPKNHSTAERTLLIEVLNAS